jgi:BrnA antitoxin of type II toxin-antitoxin system
MKKNYDFSKGKRNPYARRLKRQITIRLDEDTLAYFKRLAKEAEVPDTHQSLLARLRAGEEAPVDAVGSRVGG